MLAIIKQRYFKYRKKIFYPFYRYLNAVRKRKRILLFTDSRGRNIVNPYTFDYYSDKLVKRYAVNVKIQPEKWTTTLDFLRFLKENETKQYDWIILHTLIVDVSPRHQEIAINRIYKEKKAIFDEIFGSERMNLHLNTCFEYEYEGDKTVNMYSLEMAEKYLLPELQKIPNLIFISGNHIVKGWNGNYWKERPKNMEIIDGYFSLFEEKLERVVKMMHWTEDEVKVRTFDNIHPNKVGSEIILKEVIEFIK